MQLRINDNKNKNVITLMGVGTFAVELFLPESGVVPEGLVEVLIENKRNYEIETSLRNTKVTAPVAIGKAVMNANR